MGRGGPWKHVGGRSMLGERGVEKRALQVLGMACEVRHSTEVEGEVGHGQGMSLAREGGAVKGMKGLRVNHGAAACGWRSGVTIGFVVRSLWLWCLF